MKKLLLSLLSLSLTFGAVNAQLSVGTTVPDFTATDIDGNTHNLYTYLDAGYTVLIDNSATWCGPCWSAHNSHFMRDLYNEYGPTGTVEAGKVMVLYLESDNSTTIDDLNGLTTASQGDWVTGTPYPIIDNASFNTMLGVTGFPTFTVICPSRKVSYSIAGFGSSMGNTAFWMPYIDACPVKVTGINVGTVATDVDEYACTGSPIPIVAEIMNLGTTPLTTATITAKVDGTTIASTTYSGSLATYEAATVTVGDYSAASGVKNIVIEATTSGDVNAGDNTQTVSVTGVGANYRSWNVQVKTDYYPGEVSWSLKNSSGTTVASHTYTAGPESAGGGGDDAMKVFDNYVTLDPSECYTLTVADSYGDGLTAPASGGTDGWVKLIDGDGTVIINVGAEYEYGTSVSAKSGTELDINELINANSFEVYPNPTATDVNIKLIATNNFDASIQVVNLLGQTLIEKEASIITGENIINVELAPLPAGIYILNVITDNGTIQTKVTKK